MSKIRFVIFLFAVLTITFGTGSSLFADTLAYQQTWVSGVGTDTTNAVCSRTEPCATFQHAISLTAAGGTVTALDPGDFGALSITQSVTIDGNNGFGTTPGITINAGTSGNVILRGLNITYDGTVESPIKIGVELIANGGSLTIDNCTISNFSSGSSTGYYGLDANGTQISGSITANVNVVGSRIYQNAVGLHFTNFTQGLVSNTVILGSSSRGLLVDGNRLVTINTDTCMISGCKVGIVVNNTNGTVRMNHDTVLNNPTANFSVGSAGGSLVTAGSNFTGAGAFTSSTSLR